MPTEDFIEPLHKSPGLYFDPVGTMKLINDYLHVVIPIDIKYIKPHIDNINGVFGTARYLCQQSDALEDVECHNIIQPLKALYDGVVRDYNSISHFIPTRSKRSAWFSGVGTILKHVFGTMDDNDANKYNDAIQNLQNNDKQLTSLLKQNIIMSTAAISKVNETIHFIAQNEGRLNDAVDTLVSSLRNVTDETHSMQFKNKLTNVFNVLNANLLTLTFQLEDITNSILFSKTNTLHSAVITPTELYNDLVSSIKYLPKLREFPTPLDLSNIHVITNLSELVSYILDSKLIFVLRIPLVYHIEFDFYKTIPVPIPHDTEKPDSYAMIIPTKPYIALSKDKSNYCSFEDLNICKHALKHTYICDLPSSSSTVVDPICEIEIITKVVKTLPPQCKTKFLNGKIDIWQNINHNKWIFVQSELTKITLDCESYVRELTISGTGVLNMQPQCIAFCKNIKLFSRSDIVVNVSRISSDFNLINDSCCNINTFQKAKIHVPAMNISNINLEYFQNYEDSSKETIKKLDSLLDNYNIVSNHASFPIITVIVLLLFLIFIIYYFCNGKRFNPISIKSFRITTAPETETSDSNNDQDPIPLPRLRIN